MDCVAVCMTREGLWVASNSQRITDEDIDILRGVLFPELHHNTDIYIVKNGTSNKMHAEMQLLKELVSESFETYEIGVSKPCCEECKRVLDEHGIKYSMYHNSDVINWEDPFPDN